MEGIEIRRADAESIDLVESLWDKLRQHHHSLSVHFKDRFEKMTWKRRKHNLLENTVEMLLEYAIDKSTDQIIGFCVTVIKKNPDVYAEVESLYIEKEYRKYGIGKQFIENAISWMNSYQVETQKIVVSAGNDEVLDFYAQFDFQPMFITLQKTRD